MWDFKWGLPSGSGKRTQSKVSHPCVTTPLATSLHSFILSKHIYVLLTPERNLAPRSLTLELGEAAGEWSLLCWGNGGLCSVITLWFLLSTHFLLFHIYRKPGDGTIWLPSPLSVEPSVRGGGELKRGTGEADTRLRGPELWNRVVQQLKYLFLRSYIKLHRKLIIHLLKCQKLLFTRCCVLGVNFRTVFQN